MAYATLDDITILFRALTPQEEERANALLPVVEDSLRMEAMKVGKDLDKMIENKELFPNVLKSVIVDIIARTIMTSTNSEPMTQTSQSALGYSFSGTFLNPGGGLFIKKSELARLGLKKQKYGVIDLYA
jgi:hypothetical protein